MHERVIDETKKHIMRIMDEGLEQGNNLEHLDKLIDIQKDAYEIICMKEGKEMYGNYSGRGPEHGSYGNYGEYGRDNYGEYGNNYGNNYGRRGVDSKYRGHDSLDRMYGEYGRYQESRERYGANGEDTNKSFHYMLEAYKDFGKVLNEEAETPQQKQMLKEAMQSMMM